MKYSVIAITSFLLLTIVSAQAEEPAKALGLSTGSHSKRLFPANLASSDDFEILKAVGDVVNHGIIKNSCDEIVKPQIAYFAPGFAIEIEASSGACAGSNLPSDITVLSRNTVKGWNLEISTIGAGFRLAGDDEKHPTIFVQYPSYQKDCPVLMWDGSNYVMSKGCK